MRLAGPAVLARIEEGKQLFAVVSVLPCPQASIRRLQIALLQHIGLLLVGLGRADEVFGDNRELVEHEYVARISDRYVGYVEIFWRVLEGINLLLGRVIVLWRGLLCECWAVSQLKLVPVSILLGQYCESRNAYRNA